jgi:hypothetical protein
MVEVKVSRYSEVEEGLELEPECYCQSLHSWKNSVPGSSS